MMLLPGVAVGMLTDLFFWPKFFFFLFFLFCCVRITFVVSLKTPSSSRSPFFGLLPPPWWEEREDWKGKREQRERFEKINHHYRIFDIGKKGILCIYGKHVNNMITIRKNRWERETVFVTIEEEEEEEALSMFLLSSSWTVFFALALTSFYIVCDTYNLCYPCRHISAFQSSLTHTILVDVDMFFL